jgi:hypothetical protein
MFGLLIILIGVSLLLGGVLFVLSRRTSPGIAVPEPTDAIDLTPRDPWARARPVAVGQAARNGHHLVGRDILPGR